MRFRDTFRDRIGHVVACDVEIYGDVTFPNGCSAAALRSEGLR